MCCLNMISGSGAERACTLSPDPSSVFRHFLNKLEIVKLTYKINTGTF